MIPKDRSPWTRRVAVGVCLVALPLTTIAANDWPQWRGPTRHGTWTESGILERFPDAGLTASWRTPVRGGFAGPVVADGRVFILDYQETPGSRTMDGMERLLALDEETGRVLWASEWPATYRNLHPTFATGPRATPSVDGDQIFVVGAAGMILALDTATGDPLWQVDTTTEYGITVPVYGVSGAPLVDGSMVIVLMGAEPDALVVAFDKATGEEVWRALPTVSETGYAAPVIYEAGGMRQLIVWHPRGVSSLDPQTGELHWQHDWEISNALTVASPVSAGPYLVLTHFRLGSLMLRLDQDRPGASELWRGTSRSELPGETEGLHALITTPVIIGDYLYGVGSYGELRCLDARTGERVWETAAAVVQERWGTAMLVAHPPTGRVFIYNEMGELILAELSPKGYTEIDRVSLITPTTRTRGGASGRWGDRPVAWAHPAFANRHVIVRNDEEVVRLSLAAADY